jgi:hypothetical protein
MERRSRGFRGARRQLCLSALAGRCSYIRSPVRQRFDRASRAGKHSHYSLARIPVTIVLLHSPATPPAPPSCRARRHSEPCGSPAVQDRRCRASCRQGSAPREHRAESRRPARSRRQPGCRERRLSAGQGPIQRSQRERRGHRPRCCTQRCLGGNRWPQRSGNGPWSSRNGHSSGGPPVQGPKRPT